MHAPVTEKSAMIDQSYCRSLLSLILICCWAVSTPSLPARREAGRAQEERRGAGGQGGRLRPPDDLKCPVNDVTSFTGRVLAYSRRPGSIFIRVRTDESTTESFTLRFPKGRAPLALLRLGGEPFKQGDWALVERSRKRLRPGIRATVWACYRNNQPQAELIDWDTRGPNSGSVY
ncbi:MAG TPA: hypothetical protein VF723_06580 [Pyrinomonadaceae bacterium]|jgi:hypothetical protein